MNAAVHSFVAGCSVCLQAKPDRSLCSNHCLCLKEPGKSFPWILWRDHLSLKAWMSFLWWLTPSLNIVISVAQLFMTNIYKLHGMPTALIYDRDRIFTSKLWQELFRLVGVELKMSSSYHPQTDEQTEHVNQCMETFLRCFVHACPTKWFSWLYLAEFWYNTSSHSALGRSPFEVLYGHAPRVFGIQPSDASLVSDLTAWLSEHELM